MSRVFTIALLYFVALIAMLIPQLSNASSANGGEKVALSKQSMSGETAKRLSTSMTFSGSRVGGQYQVPGEATARIENEKPIEELLGLRTQFRDRMKQDEERK
ncbi:MAG: hypothetical protein J0L82_17465 [Deltaproteobacteria bacterium]|jgi:hypothetical protein|nr:hypothetical protein [Deltaproteobacteria bacterium]